MERLECMTPSASQNYDYVVLQATDNSVPFYESLGFVRVGCITEDEKFDEKQKKDEPVNGSEKHAQSSRELVADPNGSSNGCEVVRSKSRSRSVENAKGTSKKHIEMPNEVVSSAIVIYKTEKQGENPSDIAKSLNCNVWDIIFLNKDVYSNLVPGSCLIRGTEIFVPAEKAVHDATSNMVRNQNKFHGKSSAIQWHLAGDNETPKMIAQRFGLNCRQLVKANKDRLADLQPSSRLIQGTRMRVSHFHIHDDKHFPYCHWTFPDDTLEDSDPSYMMAKKLNRRYRSAAKLSPVENSLSVPGAHWT